jgi:cytoskeleton protein RodZ
MGKTVKIGTFLQKKREAKDISINDVASKTKINLNILKHLEANELDSLPNKTYVKGFVKSYCKLLALNTDEALEILENTYKPEAPVVQQASEQKTEEAPKPTTPAPQAPAVSDEDLHEIQDKLTAIAQSIFNKKIIMPVLVLLVVGIILKGVVNFFVQLSNEQKELTANKETSQEVKEDAKAVSDTNEIAIGSDPTIKGKDENLFDSEANKKLKDEVVKDIEDKKLAEEKAKEEAAAKKLAEEKAKAAAAAESKKEKEKKDKKKTVDLNGKFPYKKFYRAPRNMYQVLNNAPENNDTNLLPTRFKNAVESDIQNVYIHATSGDTWISYQSDDSEIKRFVLKNGRSVLIKGKVILLFMGNINVAHIYYNNKLIKTESKTGVKSLIFPQEVANEYELPLFPAYKGVPYKASDYKANMASE